MKPPPFLYQRPATLDEALSVIAEHGDEAKVLAGGQSMVPLLNFRLASPSVLVDLAAIKQLSYIRSAGGTLVVGAMTRQREAELSEVVGAACPLVQQALRFVGHVQIRHRGTVGGSMAHADPAAELPAVAVALDAEYRVASRRGERVIPARKFFEGPFMTALEPDELLIETRFPATDGARTAFHELARRSGDFAIGGVAVKVRVGATTGTVDDIGLACLGMGGKPIRLEAAEETLMGRRLTEDVLAEAANAASGEVDPSGDIHADETYRRELIGTLLTRALRAAVG